MNTSSSIMEHVRNIHSDVILVIPRLLPPSPESYVEPFREFNRERRFELSKAEKPLKVEIGNLVKKTFIYALKYKLMDDRNYLDDFLSMCQEIDDGDVCILGISSTTT